MLTRSTLTLTFLSAAAAFGQTPAWNHNPAAPNGPLHWGAVEPADATCGNQTANQVIEVGKKQTPVNIETGKAVAARLPALTFAYQPTAFKVEGTGHVVEVPYEAGSLLRIGPSPLDEYQLKQFHIHAPSEHTIDGKFFDAELHLVHANTIGELAVVGVLLKSAPSGGLAVLDDVMGHLNAHNEQGKINALQVLPQNHAFFSYTGSLTTPPCTEGVRWFVLTTPVSVNAAFLKQLHSTIGKFPGYSGFENNNRPVEPLNGRTVLIVK